MSDTAEPWGDTEPADVYADGGRLDPRSLAAFVHELRRQLVELANADGAGLDRLWHYFDLSNPELDFSVQLAEVLIAGGALTPLPFHEALRSFDAQIPEWELLSDDERHVAVDVCLALETWLQAEGTEI